MASLVTARAITKNSWGIMDTAIRDCVNQQVILDFEVTCILSQQGASAPQSWIHLLSPILLQPLGIDQTLRNKGHGLDAGSKVVLRRVVAASIRSKGGGLKCSQQWRPRHRLQLCGEWNSINDDSYSPFQN